MMGTSETTATHDMCSPGAYGSLMGPPLNTRMWVAAGVTDMRCGFDTLAAKVQTVLAGDPFSGCVFLFHGRRGHLLKALWWSNGGLCSCWPSAWSGAASSGRKRRMAWCR